MVVRVAQKSKKRKAAPRKAAPKKEAAPKSVVDRMKEALAKSASTTSNQFFPPKADGFDNGKTVRLLNEPEEFEAFDFFDKFDSDIRMRPNLAHYGKKDPLEDDPSVKKQEAYVATVWNYQRSQKQYIIIKGTEYSPLPDLLKFMQENGTIKDRDFRIVRDGKYLRALAAKKPSPLRVPDAKSFTRERILEMLKADAFPKPKKADAKADDFDGGNGGAAAGFDGGKGGANEGDFEGA